MLYLINKSGGLVHGIEWGFWEHMNSRNRKLLLRTDFMDEEINCDLENGDVLAVYDGQWGYRYEDTIELKRRTI